MTLFTRPECVRCEELKSRFNLGAMQVKVEVLDGTNAEALAHLAWHGLVEAARKTLPILVLDDSSMVDDYIGIKNHLIARAALRGITMPRKKQPLQNCATNSCTLQ